MEKKKFDFIEVNFYRNSWTLQVADVIYNVYARDEFNAKRDLVTYLSIMGVKCTYDDIKTVKL